MNSTQAKKLIAETIYVIWNRNWVVQHEKKSVRQNWKVELIIAMIPMVELIIPIGKYE